MGDTSLPTKAVLEGADMRHMKWLVYGPPGIGKSTFFAQAGDVLFLSTDGGLRFIKSMHRPVDTWQTFKRYVKAIQVEQPDYKAICIDVSDALFRMCAKDVCTRRNIQHLADEAYGKGYEIAATEFETEIEKLVGIKKYGLFFTSHSRDRERKTRFSTITKTEPTLPGQAYKILHPMMDIVAHYGFDEETGEGEKAGRRMYFQPTETLDAKDRTCRLPDSMAIPSPEDGNGFELVESKLTEEPQDTEQEAPKPKRKILLRRR